MKPSSLITGIIGLVCYSVCPAGQLSVSIDGFANPTSFNNISPTLDLRVGPLVSPQVNTSTHILIEGLSPLEDGGDDYESSYSGINVNTGETQDTGILYLKMPAGSQLPAGTVASPIVGVVSRVAGWENYNLVFPITNISNPGTGETPSGTGLYDGTTLNLNLSNGSSQFIGSADYTVIDSDTIVLSPFVLTRDGITSYNMAEAVLFRNGGRFYGALTNLEANASYDSLIFTIDLDSIPDLDLDSIPDITDPAVLVPSSWSKTSVGWVWNVQESIGYSLLLGWIDLQDYPIIYHFELGWLQVVSTPQPPDTSYWLHSPNLGWILTGSDWHGDFYHVSGQNWVLNNFFNPN